MMFDSGGAARHGNGLDADTWVPLVDVDPELGEQLLIALKRARIPAYLEPAGEPQRRRLFAASADRGDAQIIVESVTRGGTDVVPLDVLEGVDTDAEFNALVGEWDIDTINAVRAAERDLTREDSDWRARLEPGFSNEPTEEDEEHYVPPPPPPLPRLSGATIFALFILVVSILVLAIGSRMGLDGDFAFLIGVAGVLVGAGLLIMRLRARPPEDEDDDGAIV